MAYKVELDSGDSLEREDVILQDERQRRTHSSFKIPLDGGQAIEIVSEYEEDQQTPAPEDGKTFKVLLDDGEEFEIPAQFQDEKDQRHVRSPSAPPSNNR